MNQTTQILSNNGSRRSESMIENDKRLIYHLTKALASKDTSYGNLNKSLSEATEEYAAEFGGSPTYHYRRYYYLRSKQFKFFQENSYVPPIPPLNETPAEPEPDVPSVAQTMVAAVQKLFDEILAENAKLRAENAMIRKQNDIYQTTNTYQKKRIAELEEDQNAIMKLMQKARQIGLNETAAAGE